MNNHLRIVKMIGVGDKGKLHKETVGVLMSIFSSIFWANRKYTLPVGKSRICGLCHPRR